MKNTKFTKLESVGSAISNFGFIYPLNADGSVDTASQVDLNDASDEWLASLSDADYAYIETLIARIEEDAKIDKIENHPAVSGVWRDSQTFIFGATLLHGYEYHGEGYITSDNAEDILEALKGVERSY